jgi:uncharacterized protein YjbI with pentapeptide repeats
MRLTGDLRRMDFSGCDLAGVVFEDADLYRVSFAGAQLEGATFLNCFAAEASLANVAGSRLRALRSSFYRADFHVADLTEAVFWDCVLAGAELRGARLRRITVTLDCNTFEELRLDRTASAELAYLVGRTRSPYRAAWLDIVGEHDLPRLERVFKQ